MAQNRGVELGLLDCLVDGGTGFIIGSTKDVKCTYKPASRDFAPETYFGVDQQVRPRHRLYGCDDHPVGRAGAEQQHLCAGRAGR